MSAPDHSHSETAIHGLGDTSNGADRAPGEDSAAPPSRPEPQPEQRQPARLSQKGHKPGLFAARPLMMCVVLGAFTAIIVVITRVLSIAIVTTIPWLAYPAPTPWFLPVIMAPLLVPHRGSALMTGVIGAAAGGSMAIFAGIIAELIFFFFPGKQRYAMWWAILAGIVIGLMAYGFMFVVPEFAALDGSLKMLALVARILIGIIYGWLAYVLVVALQRAGIGERAV